jgi:hypothetical protein
MTVDIMYQIVQFVANKFINGGNITPDEFNTLAQQSQYSFLNYLLGQFQDYQTGRSAARVEFGVNMVVRQRLAPLIGPFVSIAVDASGLAPYPSDYQQWDAFFQSGLADRIRPVQQHRLYSYLNDPIDPISTNPIVTVESDGFRIYPNTNYNGVTVPGSIMLLSYVATPPNIVWAYTPDPTTGLPVYDEATSTDPIWYDVDCLEIISRILRMVGVNLQSQEVGQFAEVITKGGQ